MMIVAVTTAATTAVMTAATTAVMTAATTVVTTVVTTALTTTVTTSPDATPKKNRQEREEEGLQKTERCQPMVEERTRTYGEGRFDKKNRLARITGGKRNGFISTIRIRYAVVCKGTEGDATKREAGRGRGRDYKGDVLRGRDGKREGWRFIG